MAGKKINARDKGPVSINYLQVEEFLICYLIKEKEQTVYQQVNKFKCTRGEF